MKAKMINKIRKKLSHEATDIYVSRGVAFEIFRSHHVRVGFESRGHNAPPRESYKLFGRRVWFVSNLNIDFVVLPATFHKF